MTTTITTPISPALLALATDLDNAVRGSVAGMPRVDAVGDAVAPHLGDPRLLAPEQCVGDPDHDRQHLLHVAGDGAWPDRAA